MAMLVAVGVALLCGVAFRWFYLARWSLWWDEGFTVWAAKLSPGQILSFVQSDNKAPLYYLMEHWWDHRVRELRVCAVCALRPFRNLDISRRQARRIQSRTRRRPYGLPA